MDIVSAAALLVIGIIHSQIGTPPRESRTSTSSAAISGRVTERGSGQPLPRIVVTLAGADASDPRKSITDEEGRYEFTALGPGKYALSAAPDEHRSTYLPQRFGEAEPGVQTPGVARPTIEVKAGEARSGLDIALSRALAIEGRVLDPWDLPMAGVEVLVSRADGLFVPTRPAFTDDLGGYRVYGLAPGRYRVCADPRGRQMSDGTRFVRTCHPASFGRREASDVILTSQDASAIDVRVQRGSSAISGSVIDAAGVPADGAGVVAAALDESAASADTMSRGGAFTLRGLTPGRYIVKAVIGGSPRGNPNPPSRDLEIGYAFVDVGPIETTGVTVALSKAVTLAGHVTFDGTPKPRPATRRMVVQLQVVDDQVSRLESRPPFASVDDNLRFELTGVYRLPLAVGVHGLPDGWVLKSVRYDGRDITHAETDFSDGSQGLLEIVLTNRVARPSVRVIDDHGEPVTSCHVVAVPADPSRWKLALGGARDTPSPDGVLKLGAVLPGEYVLVALPTYEFFTLMRERERFDSLAPLATRVTFNEGDTQTIELRLSRLPR